MIYVCRNGTFGKGQVDMDIYTSGSDLIRTLMRDIIKPAESKLGQRRILSLARNCNYTRLPYLQEPIIEYLCVYTYNY